MINKKLYELILLIFPTAGFVVTGVLYSSFPSLIPTGYDMLGEVTKYSDKSLLVFLFPILSLFVYLYFMIIPKIDSQRQSYKRCKISYDKLRIYFAVLMLIVNVFYILSLYHVNNVTIFIAFKATIAGILFLIGDRMPKIKRNYFIGVINAWTLDNNIVWMRTHRFAGILTCAVSLILFVLAFINQIWTNALFICLIIVIILVPHAYSLKQYAKVTMKKEV